MQISCLAGELSYRCSLIPHKGFFSTRYLKKIFLDIDLRCKKVSHTLFTS